MGIGTHLGLTITLDSELHDYYCSSTASAGFKVAMAGLWLRAPTVPKMINLTFPDFVSNR